MPPKPKAKSAEDEEIPEGESRPKVVDDYKILCSALNVDCNLDVVDAVREPHVEEGEELPEGWETIIDVRGTLIQPGVAHSLTSAVLCKGPGLQGTGYKLLEVLKLNSCGLGDAGVAAVAELLKDETDLHLNTLELHDNNIGLDGCLALGDALTYNFSLSKLSLNENRTLTTMPAKAIVRAVMVKTKKWRGLTHFSLSDCNFGSPACANLAKLLETPGSPLEVLDISGNNIGTDGLNQICTGLAAASTLTTLNIRECGIGFLASVHPTLTETPSDRNENSSKVVEDCMDHFKDALVANKTIVNVDMANNGIRDEAMHLLAPVFSSGHIQSFKVDVTLGMETFEQMWKVPKPAKASKKGKKKKK